MSIISLHADNDKDDVITLITSKELDINELSINLAEFLTNIVFSDSWNLRLKSDEGEVNINIFTSPDYVPSYYPFKQYNYLVRHLGGRNLVKIFNFMRMIKLHIISKYTLSLLIKNGDI